MLDWLEALVLGVIQGVTEFLPISSDGHLALAQMGFDALRGRKADGAANLFFDVMLHLGTLAAIVVHYRRHVRQGMEGLLGSEKVAEGYRRNAIIRVGVLAFIATLPLVPDALWFKPWIESAFQSLRAIGFGFLGSAVVLALTQRLPEGRKGPRETTALDALVVGLAQMLAPLPGVSRSGLTVATALGLGFSRTWAVGFSLLMAVPAILGAAVFELRKLDAAGLTAERVAQVVVAATVAGIIGYGAIIWLVRIVRGGRLWYFSVYLAALFAVIMVVPGRSENRIDAGRSQSVGGAVRSELAPAATQSAGRPDDDLDHAEPARP